MDGSAAWLLTRDAVAASIRRRTDVLLACRDSESARQVQLAMCAEDPVHFVNNFCITYDPRVVPQRLPAYLPFDLFPRQVELVRWLDARLAASEEGLLEKSRDVGWTWVAAVYALNKWRFHPGFQITFGSRKVELVDKLGSPDSILEKVRLVIDRLPPWMLPQGWRREAHAQLCKIINPENGNVIGGEGGDEMGRGGRATAYFIDEGAYINHADSVAAAVLANSNCRVWASSVNGPGDYFARKRHDGSLRPDQIFTFHWRDDPRKTEEWAKGKRRELAATPWLWAQEYDIDYSAATEGVCIPTAWVESSIRLGEELARRDALPSRAEAGAGVAGLDVGDGCARSVLSPRFGPLVVAQRDWAEPDTTNTAFQALEGCRELGIVDLAYDTIGVGKGVSSTLKLNPISGLTVHPINVGSPADWRTVWPDGQRSSQMFANSKAELWWLARERFRSAAELLCHLTGEEVAGVEPRDAPIDECFVFEPAPPHAYRQLAVELSTPARRFNARGKILVETKQELAKRGVASPDHAEGLVLSLAVKSGPRRSTGFVAPIVATAPRGFPELDAGGSTTYVPTPRPQAPAPGAPAPFSPVVTTPGRFQADFARDR